MPGQHTGKLTLHRVPRPILVAALVAVLVFLAHLFGMGEKVAGADLAEFVNRALDGIVLISTAFGYGSLAHALQDPNKSVVD